MNKEFVPYEKSLTLKELGFNEICYAFYITDFDPVRLSRIGEYQYGDKKYIPAPLYSQVFRWLREEHKLVGTIDIGSQEYSYRIWNDKWEKKKPIDFGVYSLGFTFNGTYEEAQDVCLEKLIEMVKQNKIL